MADSQLGWSDAQWEKVNNAVTEAFAKASVASAFLPCYGPLADSAEYVRDERFTQTGPTVSVGDDTTLKLFNLTVKVELSSEQVADDSLSSALLAFRRAANTLAQVEDDVVFNGVDFDTIEETKTTLANEIENETTTYNQRVKRLEEAKKRYSETNNEADQTALQTSQSAHRASETKLLNATRRKNRLDLLALVVVAHPDKTLKGLSQVGSHRASRRTPASLTGETLVSAVVKAISKLEDDSHPGPFASVLGNDVFAAAHRPQKDSMVLPSDRITPLLNGPLLRSGQMDNDTGIVVSLAGSDIDIVVATPPKVQFLQVNEKAKYLFRVYEKFVLRIKDEKAVRALDLT
jgi:uncharacterized linocin/CFP29 family protein